MRRPTYGTLLCGPLLVLFAWGCTEPAGFVRPIDRVAIALSAPSLAVGDVLQATAHARDGEGRLVFVQTVAWSSSDPTVASVSKSGFVRGLAPGDARIVARVGMVEAAVALRVASAVVGSVRLTPDSLTLVGGNAARLEAVVRSSTGTVLGDRQLVWASSDTSIVAVDSVGRVTARGVGVATISATSEGQVGIARVSVTRLSSVRVLDVSPALLVPGGTAVITGAGFSPTRASNTVTVGGVPATVTAASATQLTVTLGTAGYACAPTSDAPVTVATAGEQGTTAHPLQSAVQRVLGVGESLTFADAATARCNEFAATGGRFVVSVANASTAPGTIASFRLRGAAATAPAGRVPTIALVPPAQARAEASASRAAGARSRALPTVTERPRAAEHLRGLELSAEAGRAFASVRRTGVAAPARQVVAARPSVGDTSVYRMLDAAARRCDAASVEVRARTVYVGRRVIVMEDVTAPLAGMMDSYFERIGQEFDDVQFPIVEANFGSPLALDARTDRNGRVILLFTRQVNERPGVLGLVLSCDFVPRASGATASNEAEIIYAAVPTNPGAGFGDAAAQSSATGTRDAWRRRIRATLVHELKHVASYAQRFAAEAPFEELWLEEGTALVAEELWARTVYGNTLRGNATYSSTIACDLRPTSPACVDAPYALHEHFARLYDYLRNVETLSPLLTDPAQDPRQSYYASSWWLLRYAIDHSGGTDAAFLRPLVASQSTGVANLAARAGRAWPVLLAEWTLATAVDDLPGFVPQRAQLTVPSWNTRDIFAGLHTDLAGTRDARFARRFPLAPRLLTFGDFGADDVITVSAGTAAIFELSGAQSARQLLELRGATAGPPPTSLSMSIVRIQ